MKDHTTSASVPRFAPLQRTTDGDGDGVGVGVDDDGEASKHAEFRAQDEEDAQEARPPPLLARLRESGQGPFDLDGCLTALVAAAMPVALFERRMRALSALRPSSAPLVIDAATLWLVASLAGRQKVRAACKHARRMHAMPAASSQACALAADGVAMLATDAKRSAQLLNQAAASLAVQGKPQQFLDGARRMAWRAAGYPFDSLPASNPVVDAALAVLFGHTAHFRSGAQP
jgi:hypothetical protein